MTKSISKKIGRIKKNLFRMGVSQEIIDYVEKHIEKRDDKINSLILELEKRNRKCCPINERYIEVKEVTKSMSKLTINPCDGRITVKFSDKTSDKVKEDILNFVTITILSDVFEPVTCRGTFHFNDEFKNYSICLTSQSKKYTKKYRFKRIINEITI